VAAPNTKPSAAARAAAAAPDSKRSPSVSMWPKPSQPQEAPRSSHSQAKDTARHSHAQSKDASRHDHAQTKDSSRHGLSHAKPSRRGSDAAPSRSPDVSSKVTQKPSPGATTRPAAAPSTTGIAVSPPAPADVDMPAFDSTQTIRALTPLELQDGQASKSFAIQLLLTEEPIHPEQIPNLDIFEAYRLYVVSGLTEEGIKHALRLGFFTSDVAAEAVAGYLKAYFEKPEIKRVSLAEHDRFQDRRVAARKDVGATGTHKAIELTSRPPLPERRAKIEVTTAKQPNASTPSLWSRLLKR
jgi:hypothetical protein